jgi:hypothetical protein
VDGEEEGAVGGDSRSVLAQLRGEDDLLRAAVVRCLREDPKLLIFLQIEVEAPAVRRPHRIERPSRERQFRDDETIEVDDLDQIAGRGGGPVAAGREPAFGTVCGNAAVRLFLGGPPRRLCSLITESAGAVTSVPEREKSIAA